MARPATRPAVSGVGRTPPDAAPTMSAAAIGTMGAGPCGGFVTAPKRRDRESL